MGLVLAIEPEEAVKHGLPPARIRADLTGVPMMPFEYPAPDTYVTLSGPPGGPLFFYILALPRRISSLATLQEFVQERFGHTPAFTLGAASPLSINGQTYPAQLFFSGSASAASVSCAVAVPAAEVGASVPGLLLVFGHGGRKDSSPPHTAERIANAEPLALILARLSWDLCIPSNERKGVGTASLAPVREEAGEDLIEVSPEDAMTSGLPPVQIVADVTGLNVVPDVLGGPEEYLFLAGPAGSALFFTILTLPFPISGGTEFLELVRKYHGDDPTFAFGEQGAVTLRGEIYPAAVYFGVHDGAPMACVAVLIPSPENVECPGLLILFGDRGAPGSAKLADLRRTSPFRELLDRLQWDFEVDADAELEDEEDGDPEYTKADDSSARSAISGAPTAQQAAKPEELSRWVGTLSQAMRNAGVWMEHVPASETYGTLTPVQQQLWTLQAALQALEPALKQAQENQPNEPLFGIVESVRAFSAVVPSDGDLAQIRKLIDRGP